MTAAWDVDVRPQACPGLVALVAVLHAAVGTAPWVAGCEPPVAALLSGVAWLAWRAARRAVPGPAATLRRLRSAGPRWFATLDDGVERPAEVLPGSRVLARFVFCQVQVAGQKLDWWLPGDALPASAFRRLRVALRCSQPADRPALLDSNLSTHEEAARPPPGSRQAN